MPLIKALIFDLDGVLINSEPLHRQNWIETFEAFGIDVAGADLDFLRGRRGEEVVAWVRERLGAKGEGMDFDKVLEDKRARFQVNLRSGLPVVPGSEEFLRGNKGVFPLGLVTSARLKLVGQVMLGLNWRNIFDALVGAEHVANAKPHPEPYLRAVERFNLRPEDCLVFEDSEVGIASARTAGCRVCGVSTTLTPRQLAAAGAQWTLADFSDRKTIEKAMNDPVPGAVAGWFGRLLR